MSYFVRLGDRLAVRLISQVILLHLMACMLSIGLIIWLPISAWMFVQSVRLPSVLLKDAKVVEVPLVERNLERWDTQRSAYLCYILKGLLAVPHFRQTSPASLDSLRIYEHPAIGNDMHGRTKIVEVPEEPDWNSVFKSAEGCSLAWAIAKLFGQGILTALVVYVAVRGYWLIKHGPKRRHRGYR